jgi:hypothetical protein
MKQLELGLTSIMMLTLFTFEGCSKEDKQFVEKCKGGQYIRSGEFVQVNDTYDFSHPNYAQCIFEDRREGTFGWTWEEISPPSPNE